MQPTGQKGAGGSHALPNALAHPRQLARLVVVPGAEAEEGQTCDHRHPGTNDCKQ